MVVGLLLTSSQSHYWHVPKMLTMYPVSKGQAVVVEGHVVRHVEPEPHGGGVNHGEVGLLGEVGLID